MNAEQVFGIDLLLANDFRKSSSVIFLRFWVYFLSFMFWGNSMHLWIISEVRRPAVLHLWIISSSSTYTLVQVTLYEFVLSWEKKLAV